MSVFTPDTPINNLWASFVMEEPIGVNWRTIGGGHVQGWNYKEAVYCDKCGKIGLPHGREEHRYCGLRADRDVFDCDNPLYSFGPLVDYVYPADFKRVGGIENAAIAIAHLPLCAVEFTITSGFLISGGLAMTGGGMDISWKICEAYMRLGYLPPLYLCDLPRMAGKKADEKTTWWVLHGCLGSAKAATEHAHRITANLNELKQQCG